MTDLMRQWNEAVEEFDEATTFCYDTCSAIELIMLAWLPRVPRDLSMRLLNIYQQMQKSEHKSVDSPTVKVG